ncbi:MAG: hypothetical protein IKB08_01675 [Clostridia bacterium]|nr:hypothetical protein [Clostridia bacterium]
MYGKRKDQPDYYMSAAKKKLRKIKTDQLQKEKTNVFKRGQKITKKTAPVPPDGTNKINLRKTK